MWQHAWNWDIMLSEISQSQKDQHCTIPFISGTQKVKHIEAEDGMVVARSWRREKWKLLFNKSKVSVMQDE